MGSMKYSAYASTNRRRCRWTALVFPMPRLDTFSGEKQFSDCAQRRGLAKPVFGKTDLSWPNVLMKMRLLFILIVVEDVCIRPQGGVARFFSPLRLTSPHLLPTRHAGRREILPPRPKAKMVPQWPSPSTPATLLLRVLGRRSRGSAPADVAAGGKSYHGVPGCATEEDDGRGDAAAASPAKG